MNIRGHVHIIIFLATLMTITVVFILKPQDAHQLSPYSDTFVPSDDTVPNDYLVFSPQCRIPEIQPWDKSIRTYFKSSPLLRCSKRPLLTSMVDQKNGTYLLKIEKTATRFYKLQNTDNIGCCYSEITRISESRDSYDMEADNKFKYSKCQHFQDEILLPNTTEFIRVICTLKRNKKPAKEVYRDAHAIVPILPSALRKIKEFYEENEVVMPLDISQVNSVNIKHIRRLNVMILGIDSVSRINLRRMMPKTLNFLKENEWIELNGYTKIADNTFPNLMAILTGHHVDDIYNLCRNNRSKRLDDCPYIWKQFSDVGYITAYAEDTPNISTFNYLQTGFVDKPTDYYLRPFMLAVHSSLTKRKLFGLPVCVGPVAPVDHILNYARRFLSTFNSYNHFSLFWMNSLSHNNPMTAENMDHRILRFLQDMFSIGTYNNTIILLLSDHGTRFGDFRHSFIGYYEERLPFISIWFPDWFKKEYPHLYRNVVINQKRLTCPFDIHLTLMKVLERDYTEENKGRQLVACPKCVSLFERVPWDRACKDAAIGDVWCMCHEFRRVRTDEPVIRSLGNFVKSIVDNKTKEIIRMENLESSVCATWKYSKVIRAHEIVSGANDETNDVLTTNNLKDREYMVLVELNPGRTRFEAVIRVKKNLVGKGETLSAVSSPSRLDGYSKYSNCVHSPHLKYYCYCTNI